MAHLPVDTLPSKFDVVVEGTGESTISMTMASIIAECVYVQRTRA